MRKLYETDEALQVAIESYFVECDKGVEVQVARKGEAVTLIRAVPYTVPGLAYHLGYSHRGALWDLKQRPEHTDTIRRALTRIENQRISKALLGEQESRFAQFDMINNFGYKSATAAEVNIQNTNIIQLPDQELDAKIAAIEAKLARVEIASGAMVIEGEFQAKLLE